jgi:nicotinamide mononucleotide transporter
MSWLAFIATIIGIYLNAEKNIWCWPLGIASCILWAIVAIQGELVALFVLQIVLLGMNVYGWKRWLGKNS